MTLHKGQSYRVNYRSVSRPRIFTMLQTNVDFLQALELIRHGRSIREAGLVADGDLNTTLNADNSEIRLSNSNQENNSDETSLVEPSPHRQEYPSRNNAG